MASKIVFFASALVVLVKIVSSQGYGGNCGNCGCCGCGNGGFNIPQNNQAFTVVSQSEAPTGLSVQSENNYQGDLRLGGKLPFLGSAGLQACGQSTGSGGICYGCGDKCSIGIRQNSCGCQGGYGGGY